MLYQLEQGAVEKKIIQQCMREGLPLPSKIKNAPELIFGLALFLQAFNNLTYSRTYGFVPGPISWASIEDYCVKNKLDEEQTQDMHYFIRVMDNAYLDYLDKKRSKK